MDPDSHVCLCFHVSLRKIRSYLARENPPVASLISECLSAGTGCQWCVPFLKHLHAQHTRGELPDLRVSPEDYIRARSFYRESGERDAGLVGRATGDDQAAEQGGTHRAGPHPAADAGQAPEHDAGRNVERQ